jgi:hypothetical protein
LHSAFLLFVRVGDSTPYHNIFLKYILCAAVLHFNSVSLSHNILFIKW